jgi:2-polyprenyl-3-methyl-5-hydroxy-6-metoxy-1,4-benzoquinol methylase
MLATHKRRRVSVSKETTMRDYRNIAFDSYLSYGFEEQHPPDFEAVSRHYAYNYLPFLPKDRHAQILDIGCGMGDFLYFLGRHGYTNFLGLDVGEEQVRYANRLLGTQRAILVDSTERFLENGNRYSCIVMLNVIEHIKKDKVIDLLKRIHGALAQNGVLLLKTDNLACITGAFNRYFDFTHEVGFVEPSLKQVLKLAGFQKITFIDEKCPPPYPFRTRIWLGLVVFYRKMLRLAYEFERRGNIMPTTWGKDLTAIAQK